MRGRAKNWTVKVAVISLSTLAVLAFTRRRRASGGEPRTGSSIASPRPSNSVMLSSPATGEAEASAGKQIAVPPPPMGWSSWNSFSNTVDSKIVMQQAKAMVATGLKKSGYQYVNIDEGWWLGKRDQNGNIVVDPKQWPALTADEHAADMSNIVKYIHSLGLKAGIYTDAGESGCSYYGPDLGPPEPHTGSEGHYDQDFLQFAKWGFDYVKVDWCGGNKENLDPAVQYAEIARAIARAEAVTGHHLFFSICDWGRNSPWTWAPGVGAVAGDIWRTSGDIVAPIVANTRSGSRAASFRRVLSNFDQGIHPEAQHTGFYNDPDMMVVGMPRLSDTENRVHLSLWAISGAPLIVGADLTKLSKSTLGILTNQEVIAVDQDVLGVQCIKIAEPAPGLQIWAKPLAGSGKRAVLLLNRTASPARMSVRWSDLGLRPSSMATLRDLWAQKDLGSYTSSYSANVSAGDAALLLISGRPENATHYEAASKVNEFIGGSAPAPCPACFGGESVAIGGKKSVSFENITAAHRFAYIRIGYINGGRTPVIAKLQVNGQDPTNVAFPPTGDRDGVATITVEVQFEKDRSKNVLSFSSPCSAGLALDFISVSPW
jgi:hypothetical protein